MKKTLGFIGTGNMAEALIAGLVTQRNQAAVSPQKVYGFDINVERLNKIVKKYKIKKSQSLNEIVAKSHIIVIAVKPQQIKTLLQEIQTFVTPSHLIISIAAGIDTHLITSYLGHQSKVIRAMPNTPALIGLGASAFFANRNCNQSDKKMAHQILKATGLSLEVKKEGLLDGVTGLSGSGPAYVYTFIEGMITGGKKVGLSQKQAAQLVIQTMIGATSLLKSSQQSPEQLISQVASKGGTTEVGLKVLNKKKFKNIIIECINQATKRAKTLRRS